MVNFSILIEVTVVLYFTFRISFSSKNEATFSLALFPIPPLTNPPFSVSLVYNPLSNMGNKTTKEVHWDIRSERGLHDVVQRCLDYYTEIIAFLQVQEYMTNVTYTLGDRNIQLSGSHSRPVKAGYVPSYLYIYFDNPQGMRGLGENKKTGSFFELSAYSL